MDHETYELYLNNQDAVVLGTDKNIFQFDISKLPPLLLAGDDQNIEFALERVIFSHTHYPINLYNNTLTISTDISGPHYLLVTLPEGNYEISEFVALLTTEVSAIAGFAVTFNYDTMRDLITYTCDGIHTMAYYDIGYNFLREVGFIQPGILFNTHTGGMPYDIGGPSCLLVRSNLSQFSLHSSGGSVLCEIPIDVPFGYTVLYTPNHLIYSPFRPNGSLIRFELVDSRTGRPFTLSSSSDLRFKFVLRRWI